MDTRTHIPAKFSRIWEKFKLLNAELAKQALFLIFGTIWLGFFKYYRFLKLFLCITLRKIWSSLILIAQKQNTFKRSGSHTVRKIVFLPIMPVNARDSAGIAHGKSRDKQGHGKDKQGQAGMNRDIHFLSLLVPVCPCQSMLVPAWLCLSLSVPVCPCPSLSVPVCLYICYTFMSTTADEYNSLHQNEHSYIDFPCQSDCSNACKPCFKVLLYFSSCFLNNSFIQSKQFYSSNKFKK